MAKINVLEKQVAELIAAGEVVERPASIVKELVENAVDAGASKITVEIKGGGVSYLRVTDNGSGIEREDVEHAFFSHATSKVRVQEDLESITTMGFRGEALASIAAMCRVELWTRTAEEVAGTRYEISGGERGELSDIGCPVGTTITVRDVFFNTPARMKFLKKDVSEGNSVLGIVEKAALGNPAVSFQLIRDGTIRIQTPGDGILLSAVRCVLGKEFAENAIPVRYETDGIAIEGVISRPSFARGSRALQNFFINTRFVRSKTCLAALEESYRGALMIGRFPSCVLNLTVPPRAVDVNVHPAKIEVRFANEKSIFDLVYYGCKTALGANRLAPEINMKDDVKQNSITAHIAPTAPVQQHMSAAEYKTLAGKEINFTSEKPALSPQSGLTLNSYNVFDAIYTPEPPAKSVSIEYTETAALQSQPDAPAPIVNQPEQASAPEKSTPVPYENARLIGELFGTYALLESGEELLLVDKHAAHERLLFNRMTAEGIGADRQLLLSPVSVKLSPEEHAVVLENTELLSRAGLTIEDFGDGYILLREVAPVLVGTDLPAILSELAARLLRYNGHATPQCVEDLYHTIACRAAVKAHDHTPLPALEQLIALLREDGDADHCPHGRPVAVRLTRREIEKKFGRLG